MNHPTSDNQSYSSSQDILRYHRHNPVHGHPIVGHNERLAASNARRIQHMPGGYVPCGDGMFAGSTGSTIRAEAIEVQKANVGRKCVFAASPSAPLNFVALSIN